MTASKEKDASLALQWSWLFTCWLEEEDVGRRLEVKRSYSTNRNRTQRSWMCPDVVVTEYWSTGVTKIQPDFTRSPWQSRCCSDKHSDSSMFPPKITKLLPPHGGWGPHPRHLFGSTWQFKSAFRELCFCAGHQSCSPAVVKGLCHPVFCFGTEFYRGILNCITKHHWMVDAS